MDVNQIWEMASWQQSDTWLGKKEDAIYRTTEKNQEADLGEAQEFEQPALNESL